MGPDDRIGSYRVERELGSTTTGLLYQVVHLVLPRRAVVKVLHPTRIQQLSVQLLREAILLEALSHPGVPQVYESGMLEDKRPWFAFEIIDGITLSQRLMMNGAMPAIEVARLVRDLAAILEHAHKRGIIHRALRPDHVVLSPDRRYPVAVPDWTDARAHDAAGNAASSRSQMPARGGRAYIAPEFVRGDAADDRADVYAMGVMAYQALTGVLPRGESAADRAPDAPVELTSLVDQMIATDRFDRPTSAEVRGDLAWLSEALAIDLDVAEPAPSSSATLRIRKPKWTPPIQLGPNALAPVSGEIDLDRDLDKPKS